MDLRVIRWELGTWSAVLKGGLETRGLLLKQLHKFYNRWDIPWVKLIWSTYYENRLAHAMEAWTHVDHSGGEIPLGFLPYIEVSHIYNLVMVALHFFWKDLWVGEIHAETHPRACSFARDEDVFIFASRNDQLTWRTVSSSPVCPSTWSNPKPVVVDVRCDLK